MPVTTDDPAAYGNGDQSEQRTHIGDTTQRLRRECTRRRPGRQGQKGSECEA